MPPPTVIQAISLSARATGRTLWLVPLAFALGWVGRLATGAPTLFLGAMATRGAWAGAALGDGAADALSGALAGLLAPRTLFVAAGLLLAGLLLRAGLRVLWLSGALPTLGEALAGGSAPVFAAGAVWGYPRVLATAFLGLVLETAAAGVSLLAFVASALAGSRLAGRGPGAALVGALGLTAAVALPLLAGLVADAALARAGMRGEGPARAFAAAVLRLGRRPAAFLAVALSTGAAALVLSGSLEIVSGTGIQLLAVRAPPELLAVPRLAAGALGGMLSALLELWSLGAVAALACHAAPGDPVEEDLPARAASA